MIEDSEINKQKHKTNVNKTESLKLQLYISEFNNLSERITSYLNMQSAFVAGLIVWITAVFTIWVMSEHIYIILWFGFIGFQIIELILHGFRKDQYNIALYIEEDLRPKVTKIMRDNEFWKYQSFIVNKQSKLKVKIERDFGEVILSIILLIGLVIYRTILGFTLIDIICFSLNTVFLVYLIIQSTELISLRRKIKNNCN